MGRKFLGTDLSTSKDDRASGPRAINGINEPTGEKLGVIKRPGSAGLGNIAAGDSQLMVGIRDAVLTVIDDDLYQSTPSPFAAGSPQALAPIYAGLEFTASKGIYSLSSTIGGTVMIKTSKEAWVVT